MNHQRQPRLQHRWQLEAERFARTRGQYDQGILPLEQRLHDRGLRRVKVGVAPDALGDLYLLTIAVVDHM